MSNLSKFTAGGLALALFALGTIAQAHMLRDRNFDFAARYNAPLDLLSDMLKDLPDLSNEPEPQAKSSVVPTAPATVIAPSQQAKWITQGEPVEILNTYNKAGVQNGAPRSPVFELSQPTLITHIQTYHWNNARGTPAPGQVGITNTGMWQATGRPGMLDTPNAEWVIKPSIVLQPGVYTVMDGSPETWSLNRGSGGIGFTVVRGVPVVKQMETTAGNFSTERQALEQLAKIKDFKEWALAVRRAGNTVVYNVTQGPSTSCSGDTCNWCFRISEDTPSHRTYFKTYCIDILTGGVTTQEDY